jgi:alpha-D-xyloside xylohydrolase
VRAGSIVPVGPDQQYIGEKPRDELTLYVYAGRSGEFSLYEDDGNSYGYERDEFSRIRLAWDDAARTLTIGARVGTFPGTPESRTFNVVLVTPDKPAGYAGMQSGQRVVRYTGQSVRAVF